MSGVHCFQAGRAWLSGLAEGMPAAQLWLRPVGLPEIGVQRGGFILEQRSDHRHGALTGRKHDAAGQVQRRVLGMRTDLPA